MTPAPWGRRHPKEYWRGVGWTILLAPLAYFILYGAVQLIALATGHTVK